MLVLAAPEIPVARVLLGPLDYGVLPRGDATRIGSALTRPAAPRMNESSECEQTSGCKTETTAHSRLQCFQRRASAMLRSPYTQSPLAGRAQLQNSYSAASPHLATADAGPSRAMPGSSHPNKPRRIIQDNTERESICIGESS